MSSKMKGLFKGLRYISQKFDEEQQKEQDIQIGLPTDVKHVAHIGWDGPASADLGASTPPFDAKPGDVKWVSEDSKRPQKPKKSQAKEQQGQATKPSRRRSADNNPLDTSPKKDKPSRRQSAAGDTSAKPRRTHPKDSSDGKPHDPDAPKKTRRKKSEANDQAGPRRSKNISPAANGGDEAADPGSDRNQDEERE